MLRVVQNSVYQFARRACIWHFLPKHLKLQISSIIYKPPCTCVQQKNKYLPKFLLEFGVIAVLLGPATLNNL